MVKIMIKDQDLLMTRRPVIVEVIAQYQQP